MKTLTSVLGTSLSGKWWGCVSCSEKREEEDGGAGAAGGLGVCRGSRDSEGVIAATQVCRSALCCPCPLSTHRHQPPRGAGWRLLLPGETLWVRDRLRAGAGLALTGFVGSGGAGGADGGRLPSLLLPPAEELVCGEGSLSRKGLERRQVAAVLLRRGGDLVSSSEEWQLL